ncbi:MAG: UDP-N-acetylmuramate dehydrogenase [Deltaproteobacteria bacterium]|nr:UDP-N-acetylmuramate dehydrogenase [Deltaproteobacteria bacterium]
MTKQFDLFFVQRFKGKVLFGVPMSDYTSIRIGGPADVMAFPQDEADLADLLTFAASKNFPLFVLGRGTNLLVRDSGIRGIVVNMNEGFKDMLWVEGEKAISGAGVMLAGLLKECEEKGLGGLEFACSIPGTVGGAVVMNAGAYGGEMKDVVEGVEVLNRKGKKGFLTASEIDFSYRATGLPKDAIVIRAHLKFERKDPAAIAAKIKEFRKKREETAAVKYPSAGSVFKNHGLEPAGRLIEEAGLKGCSVGDARISDAHANYIVNAGGARARDVLGLMALVRDRVYSTRGIVLEPEIKVVGED